MENKGIKSVSFGGEEISIEKIKGGSWELPKLDMKEIRIGSFLHHSEMGIVEVIAVGKDYIHCVFNGETYYESIRCFSPIPLSEEILLSCDLSGIESMGLVLDKSSDGDYYINIGKSYTEIKYLHHLQNICFDLGQELDIKL